MKASDNMHSPGYVSLDYTLYDLYDLDGGSASKIVLVFFSPFVENLQLGSDDPPKTRFLYDSWDIGFGGHEDASLQQQVLPQRYGYTAGQIPVIFANSQSPSYCASQCNNYDPSDFFRTFHKIHEKQRPIAKIAPSLADITIPHDCQISVLHPSERLSHLPHTIHPDNHYELLSKRGLAMSNLPMPKSMVIDSTWTPDLALDGVCLQAEIERMLKNIDAHPVPYILKLPQTVSGMGTFKVSSEEDRKALRAHLHPWLFHVLKLVNRSNQHLWSSSLVIQEFIQGSTMSLSLFVTKKGRAVFITCSDQIFDKNGQWIGGMVSYKRQGSLEKEYLTTSTKIAQFLHKKGYYGPAGADVLTDEFGSQYVVDLNVRLTGTYHFGPLQGHFTQKGLWEAMTLKLYLRCSQKGFEGAFDEELRNGSIIIMGWAENETKDRCYGVFTLGAEDILLLKELAQKVMDYGAGSETLCTLKCDRI